jgi:hypothetical protein
VDGNFQAEGSANAFNVADGTYCYFNFPGLSCTVNSPWTGSNGGGMIVSGSGASGGLAAPNGEGYYGFVQFQRYA